MLREECALPMDVGLPRRTQDLPDPIKNPYALWVRDALEVAYDQFHCHAGHAVRRQKRPYDKQAVKCVFAVGDWTMRYYLPVKKCKLDLAWLGSYLVVSLTGVGGWCLTAPGFSSDLIESDVAMATRSLSGTITVFLVACGRVRRGDRKF